MNLYPLLLMVPYSDDDDDNNNHPSLVKNACSSHIGPQSGRKELSVRLLINQHNEAKKKRCC